MIGRFRMDTDNPRAEWPPHIVVNAFLAIDGKSLSGAAITEGGPGGTFTLRGVRGPRLLRCGYSLHPTVPGGLRRFCSTASTSPTSRTELAKLRTVVSRWYSPSTRPGSWAPSRTTTRASPFRSALPLCSLRIGRYGNSGLQRRTSSSRRGGAFSLITRPVDIWPLRCPLTRSDLLEGLNRDSMRSHGQRLRWSRGACARDPLASREAIGDGPEAADGAKTSVRGREESTVTSRAMRHSRSCACVPVHKSAVKSGQPIGFRCPD